jgi:hypothetical protein
VRRQGLERRRVFVLRLADRRAPVGARVLAVPLRDRGALLRVSSGLVEVAAHLEPGDREGGHSERPAQHRVEGERVHAALRQQIGRLRMGFDGDRARRTAADQHHAGGEREQAVRRDGLHRSLDGAQLVGDVLVEDARAFLEVLRRAHERVDVAARVGAGVQVRGRRGLEHQLLVAAAGGGGCEPGPPHAGDADPRAHLPGSTMLPCKALSGPRRRRTSEVRTSPG